MVTEQYAPSEECSAMRVIGFLIRVDDRVEAVFGRPTRPPERMPSHLAGLPCIHLAPTPRRRPGRPPARWACSVGAGATTVGVGPLPAPLTPRVQFRLVHGVLRILALVGGDEGVPLVEARRVGDVRRHALLMNPAMSSAAPSQNRRARYAV